jgi:ubiquinone/menaquinone biosynthesis C-methylase UbiE
LSQPPPFDEKIARRVEAVYTSPDEEKQRAFVLGALDLKPGESVLDIGSGPGFCMLDNAKAVCPSGSVCGVDSSASMIALAEKRCAGLARLERER